MIHTTILLLALLPSAVLASIVQKCNGTPYIRREWRELSSTDQSAFLSGLQTLKSGSIPSKLGLSCRYDDYAFIHSRYASSAHGNPKFLVWHRRFLADFEADIAIAIGRPFPLPYWQWTMDSQAPERSSLLTPLAFGSGGTGPMKCVTDGVCKDWKNDDNTCLCRGYGSGAVSAFYSGEQVGSVVQTTTTFDALWMGLEGGLHGTVHNAIGGDMSQMTSPRDPLFFLHHAYIDKLFYDWQNGDASGARFTEFSVFGKLSDVMEPFGIEVDKVIDCRALCYTYSPGITPLQSNVSDSSSSAAPTSSSSNAVTSSTMSSSSIMAAETATANDTSADFFIGNNSTASTLAGNETVATTLASGTATTLSSSIPIATGSASGLIAPTSNHTTSTRPTMSASAPSTSTTTSKEYYVSPTDRSNQHYLRQPAPLPAAWCAMNNLNTDYIRVYENQLGQINYAVNFRVSTQNYMPKSSLQLASQNQYMPASGYAEVPASFVYPVNLTRTAANPANANSPANREYLAAVRSIAGASRGLVMRMAGWTVLCFVLSILLV